jgi:superfamily II DNA or RNA helicase
MIDISVGDINSTVLKPRSHLDALAVIREVCRARPDGFQFMPKYKAKMWDGYISLMATISSFPTGLLTLVMKALYDKGYEINLLGQFGGIDAKIDPSCLNDVTLRDYQTDAVEKLLFMGRGIAKMATNSGKTEVIAAIIKTLDIPSTIIIVHRKELMYQTAQRLEDRLGVEVGIIGDSMYSRCRVVVAMVQTLYNHLIYMRRNKIKDMMFPDNELLVVDECHHVSSDSMMDVISHIPGRYRFGLSGTPLKYDVLSDMKLIAATGDVLVDVTNEYMIQEGYSAKPVIKMYIIEETNDALWKMDYPDAYKSMVVNNKQRNDIIIDYANVSEGVVLVLVNQLEQGRLLRDAIPDSIFVHGSDSTSHRQGVLGDMREATKGIFIASPIFDEGIDVPAVDTVILAGGGKGHVKLLQRIGRGLRQKAECNELIVIDFMDDTNKYLLEHSQDRIYVYEQEGFDIEICS